MSAPAGEGPSLQRVVTLTDAVVAIAMTLLVLPLVEIAGEVDTANLRGFLVDHADVLLSFAVSFVVVHVFWAAHGSAFRRVEAADVDVPGLRQLNLGWLLVIAFLPFPTAVVGREVNTTSAPIYIGTMLVRLAEVRARQAGTARRLPGQHAPSVKEPHRDDAGAPASGPARDQRSDADADGRLALT